MMNHDKWINTLPGKNYNINNSKQELDPNICLNTIPKTEKKNSLAKYSFLSILLIFGVISVILIKNETRNIQKEINNLQTTINDLNTEIQQASLEYEVLTSPENLSKLANEYLDIKLENYKKSQINKYNIDNNITAVLYKKKDKKKTNFSDEIKTSIKEKIEQKKVELQKLQQLYSKPESIPEEVKVKINKTTEQLKELYTSPETVFTKDRVQKWAGIQVVKVFLGIPIVPGK